MKISIFAVLVFLLFGVLFVPHWIYSPRRYNVLLITIDTLRSDHLSCYNSRSAPTPNINRIAQEGVMFTNAHSLIPITLPAHTSILTSHRPHKESVFDNGNFFVGKSPLLSEILRKENYQTAGFVSLAVLRRAFGLARGFQKFDDDFASHHRAYRVASEMNAAAIPWIKEHRKQPFFAWIHYSDPHEPTS
jgi:membrane-anchored protein YejM (alkaline phosphatase superfamily)